MGNPAAFIDREEELAHLERLYGSKRAEFFVLYGRRHARRRLRA